MLHNLPFTLTEQQIITAALRKLDDDSLASYGDHNPRLMVLRKLGDAFSEEQYDRLAYGFFQTAELEMIASALAWSRDDLPFEMEDDSEETFDEAFDDLCRVISAHLGRSFIGRISE